MADDYIELLLKWTLGAVIDVLREWLEQRGVSIMPMKSGLLLSGTRSQIERTFRSLWSAG